MLQEYTKKIFDDESFATPYLHYSRLLTVDVDVI